MYFKAKPLHNHWIYKRGDIYLVDLGPGDGSIQGGTRPAINYQNNTANLFSTIITIVPVTSQIKRLDLPCHVFIGKEGGLRKDSMAMLEQMDTLPKRRFLGISASPARGRWKRSIRLPKTITADIFPMKWRPRNMSKTKITEPIMITLCGTCATQFFHTGRYRMYRADRFQSEKDECTYCGCRRGYDYLLYPRTDKTRRMRRRMEGGSCGCCVRTVC